MAEKDLNSAIFTAANKYIDEGAPGGTATDPEFVAVVGNQVTLTDRSGTITLGGTAQTLMAANTSRRGYWIQNKSTENMYVSSVATASATAGIMIGPNQLYECPESGVPLTAISIYAATTSSRFEAREW